MSHPSPLVKNITIVRIANQDLILLLNNQIISTVEANDGNQAAELLEEAAEGLSKATGVAIDFVDAQKPENPYWSYEDVLQALPSEETNKNCETFNLLVRIDLPKTEKPLDVGDVCGMLDSLIDVGFADAKSTVEEDEFEGAETNERAELAAKANIHGATGL